MSVEIEARRAKQRAGRLYRAPGFVRAYVSGAVAAAAGRPADVCPYAADRRKTWRNSYRRAWLRGWESVALAG